MSDKLISAWLAAHGIQLDTGFAAALRAYADIYKGVQHLQRLDDVYQRIGVSKQTVWWWERHPLSTQTKNLINAR